MFAACSHSEALLYLQLEKHRLGTQQGNFAMEWFFGRRGSLLCQSRKDQNASKLE